MQRLVRQQFFSGDSGMGIVGSSQGWIRRLLSGSAILACALLPAAAAGEHLDRLLEEEREMLSLYFGEEQLVEVATRHPKPLSQVAENVTVITAAEIEAMHAHSVAEVLERVPGIFMSFYGRGELGSRSGIFIHGSEYEHVLVLVDGIRWNYVSSDFPETNDIPVNIIDRIEVIKGAASSAWGSALGGVVNIITKKTGRARRPSGELGLALGEHDTSHAHAELAGSLADNFGYYLFEGRRKSDGILNQRYFEDSNLFGKLSYQLPGRSRIGVQAGYSQPENRYLNINDLDFSAVADERSVYYVADFDSVLSPGFHFFLQLYGRENKITNTRSAFSTTAVDSETSHDSKQRGANSRLAWQHGRHAVVAGAEYLYRENRDRNELDDITALRNREEIWSLFLNDTIRLGRWTVTPGLRYDRLTLADDQLSPSLGGTFLLTEKTILRAVVSRGFRKPTVSLREGDPDFHDVSPGLESETIRTYQAGLETTALPYLWLKATGFHHEAKHVWAWHPDALIWVNSGSAQRTGLEISARTMPFFNLSLGADYTFVRFNPVVGEKDNQYQLNLLLEYLDRKGLRAQLFGRYVQWSYIFSDPEWLGEFDNMIWDLTVSQAFPLRHRLEAALFFKAHNLFNTSQFADEWQPNAPRWLEAGLRFRF
jgi:vitamin B12 transporter